MIAPATAETLEGGSRALVRRWRKPVDQWLSETAAPIGHSMTTSTAGDDPGCQQADDRDHSSTPGHATVDALPHEHSNLEVDTLTDWKPFNPPFKGFRNFSATEPSRCVGGVWEEGGAGRGLGISFVI